MEKSEFMTTGDAARAIDVSPQAVQGYENKGLLKCIRTERGMRLFRRETIEKFAADRRASLKAGGVIAAVQRLIDGPQEVRFDD